MDALCAVYVHICSWISALSNSNDSKTGFSGMWKKRYHIKNNCNAEYHLTAGYSCNAKIFNINNSNRDKHIIAGVYTTLCTLNQKVSWNIIFNADWIDAQVCNFGGYYGLVYCTDKHDHYE